MHRFPCLNVLFGPRAGWLDSLREIRGQPALGPNKAFIHGKIYMNPVHTCPKHNKMSKIGRKSVKTYFKPPLFPVYCWIKITDELLIYWPPIDWSEKLSQSEYFKQGSDRVVYPAFVASAPHRRRVNETHNVWFVYDCVLLIYCRS